MASAIRNLQSQRLGKSGPALGVSLEKVLIYGKVILGPKSEQRERSASAWRRTVRIGRTSAIGS